MRRRLGARDKRESCPAEANGWLQLRSGEVSRQPVRVGLCHCRVCRKETGSIGNFFAVWQIDRISVTGETRSWRLSTDNRHSCPVCGSSVFAIADGANEVECEPARSMMRRPGKSQRAVFG
jgi:hypothetical protein